MIRLQFKLVKLFCVVPRIAAALCFFLIILLQSCGRYEESLKVEEFGPSKMSLLNADTCQSRAPAAGALVMRDAKSKRYTLVCSATLIRQNTVLTAAHCFGDPAQQQNTPLYFTLAEDLQMVDEQNRYQVEDFVIPPEYHAPEANLFERDPRNSREKAALDYVNNKCGLRGGPRGWSAFERLARVFDYMTPEQLEEETTWAECVETITDADILATIGNTGLQERGHDIAVVFLKSSIDRANPARLPRENSSLELNRSYLFTGYGRYRQSDLEIVPKNNGCKRCKTFALSRVLGNEASYENKVPTACFGDSGGGAFSFDDSCWRLVGVFSRADTLPFSLRCRGEGILTNVSAHTSWIEETIRRHR